MPLAFLCTTVLLLAHAQSPVISWAAARFYKRVQKLCSLLQSDALVTMSSYTRSSGLSWKRLFFLPLRFQILLMTASEITLASSSAVCGCVTLQAVTSCDAGRGVSGSHLRVVTITAALCVHFGPLICGVPSHGVIT